MDRVVRVLVVDDSAYIRKVVKKMLSRSPFIEVVGTARDGQEALELVEQLQPDVLTLDLIMPNMDGLELLQTLRLRRPVPTIILSIASETGEMALEALAAGAVDFVQKPTALATEKVFDITEELIQKVKAASVVSLTNLQKVMGSVAPAPMAPSVIGSKKVDLVVMGISTGGPQALSFLIPQLPADLSVPVAIVLHMPVGYTELYANRLNEICSLKVVEAKDGVPVCPGVVLVAPAGRHLKFVRQPDGTVVTLLEARPFDTLHRPSVDVLFQSAAEVYGERVLGVVMTGMGSDGKQGAAWIKSAGGTIFTEAEETCVVYGMPRSVFEAGLSDQVIPLEQMAPAILDML
ncbi:chemotaxis-specific protein-glutamate methyltransferase CheB [Ancylothrix sp. C2]|uniref:chemotaxis-specific protein-glutamate methyltransferase CheB n=1 Tax=Ancylothrix sp. D3o TaxID=2953691 RepID=UPI0021BB811A|nr:chemotaxis-specific protein-glutamate methyltransferase CheB [Ancylothrix sp. D3o]MCT7952563.1 chemotaxis-specific protein-glutamate methyltransferase CheB [Ancylothrix sp. D3o]